jgi:hypothetical protein
VNRRALTYVNDLIFVHSLKVDRDVHVRIDFCRGSRFGAVVSFTNSSYIDSHAMNFVSYPDFCKGPELACPHASSGPLEAAGNETTMNCNNVCHSNSDCFWYMYVRT